MWKLAILFDARIKTKKIDHVLEFNQSQWLKPYIEFNSQKKNRSRKNNGKDGKALHKLINNAIYGKAIENLRNRINVKLGSNEKDIWNVNQNQALCRTKYLTIIYWRYVKANLH